MNKREKFLYLKKQMSPLPWPITKRYDEGYTLNCGKNKIICYDSVTLDFITLAVEIALEVGQEWDAQITKPTATAIDTPLVPTF